MAFNVPGIEPRIDIVGKPMRVHLGHDLVRRRMLCMRDEGPCYSIQFTELLVTVPTF